MGLRTTNYAYRRLTEHFVNLLDSREKQKYLEVIWPLIELSYSRIGGYTGSKESLVQDTSLWKLVRRDGKIVAGQLFKDKLGNKMVCGFSDGTDLGKNEFKRLIVDILRRNKGWMEASGIIEYILSQHMNPMPIEKALKVLAALGKEPVSVNSDGFHYTRMIKGKPHQKAMFGIPDIDFSESFDGLMMRILLG